MSELELNKELKVRFDQLPKVVQSAILSADIQQHLRKLADTNKLHLDQWQLLENNVVLTLLGFQEPNELGNELQKDLGISRELSETLAKDVSKIVFEPIRQELERQLEHPEAKDEEKSGVEAAREQVLAGQQQGVGPTIVPATPPMPPPATKIERGPASGAYKPGETSGERKSVHDDPYRESPA